MSSCLSLNCTDALTAPPLLQPNPDVSGIGVLIGFFVTAYLSLILLVIQYVLVFDPAEAGLTNETRQENAIDREILNFVAKWITRPQKTWKKALEKMIVMMSDQQMVTGIALLSSAMTQLRCNLSAYHWQITIYLVWFSSFTHLATLTFLRGYLRENSPLRWWRLFFMTVLIGLLVAALIPTGNDNWLPVDDPEMAGVPAICLFDYSFSDLGSDIWNMLFSILVLCISYTTRAVKLFVWSSKFSKWLLRTAPGTMIKRHLQKLYTDRQIIKANKWIFTIPYYITLSILLMSRSWLDLLESMFWEITWLLIALLWGTLRLFATRNPTMHQDVNILEENFWGFGQCLATAMLVLLFFSGVETYIETKKLPRKDPPILTNPDGNLTSINVGGIEGRADSHSPTTDSSDNSFVTPGTSSEPNAVEGAVITTQAIVETGTDQQLRSVARSPKSLSWEERSLETLSPGEIAIQSSSSEVEPAKFSHATLVAPVPTTELRHPPPHERDYYDDTWYRNLAIFNYGQIIFLSAGILSGAYSAGRLYVYPVGFFGSARDVGAMFRMIVNWVFLYAPLSSFIITIYYVFFTETHIRRQRCLKAVDYFLFLAVAVFSTMTSGHSSLPWENFLPFGQIIMTLWVYGPFSLAYILWCGIISYKLHRENKI